jgi:Glycosyltransferase family 87
MLALTVGTLAASLFFYLNGAHHHGDIDIYHNDAHAFWLDGWPPHVIPAEYPLLALLPFSLTMVPPVHQWVIFFGLWMLVLFVAGFVVLARRESPRVAEIAAVYLALGGFATTLGRYDLVPLTLTVAAYWLARGRRFLPAYVLLAAGALLKLYPAALLPIIAIEQYRVLGRNVLRSRPPGAVLAGIAAFCAIVSLGFGLTYLLDPAGWLGPFSYGLRRPIQVESVAATLLWAGSLAGFPVSPDRSFHSFNLVGSLQGAVGMICSVAFVAGVAWVLWRQTTGKLDLGRAMVAILLVVICTGRVFSPQYLIWVLPLIAIVERRYNAAWLLICALTTLIFPIAYSGLRTVGSAPPVEFPLWFLGPIALRNIVMVVTTVRFLSRTPPLAALETREWPRSSAA